MNSAGTTVVAPRVRLYVVDPRKFRKPSSESSSLNSTVELPRLLPKAQLPTSRSEISGVTSLTVMTAFPSTSTSAQVNGHGPSSSNISQPNEVEKPAPKTTTKKKKPRKRKVDRETARRETESDKKLKVFLATESTTRVGRLSKNPPRLSQNEVTTPSATSTAEPPPKIKIREPPDVFRCQACQKVYLGHTKLQLHYKTFPDHQIKNANNTYSTMHSSPAQQAAIATSTQTNGFLPMNRNGEKSLVSVGIQVSFQPDFSTVDLRRNESCSPASRNIIRNHTGAEQNLSLRRMSESPGIYVADTMLPRPDSRSQPGLEPITVPDLIPPTSLSPRIENGLTNGFGDSAFSSFRVSTQNSSHQAVFQMNGHVNVPISSPVPVTTYQFNPPFTPPGDYGHNGGVGSNEKTPGTPGVRSIWDIVDDKIIQIGINQILTEISDVAERLSKLARDKFIPIREEEERLYCSSPIIQVDNPFLSHLLDLPFGTYVFREDAGVRIKAPPPPSAAELSLTGEVDVDKFLSPDILNLPHLTNIDFAAIL